MHETQERKPVHLLEPDMSWKPLGDCIDTTPEFEMMHEATRTKVRSVKNSTLQSYIIIHCGGLL